MKIPKSTLIPVLLLIYLGVMSFIGWDAYRSGKFSALYYFGTIAGTLLVIILLHFSLKRREKLKNERQKDISQHNNKP